MFGYKNGDRRKDKYRAREEEPFAGGQQRIFRIDELGAEMVIAVVVASLRQPKVCRHARGACRVCAAHADQRVSAHGREEDGRERRQYDNSDVGHEVCNDTKKYNDGCKRVCR
jgi:hypothetical protein